jgi:hypothetical protein
MHLKNNVVIGGILPDSLATSSCEELCPRQPVGFLLANDPGRGKTIRALGLVSTQNTPTRRVYCTAPTRLANLGDTLVSVRAPVGDVNMASEDCARSGCCCSPPQDW